MRKALFSILVVLLAAAFAISAFLVGSYLLEGKEQKEKYDQLSEMVANAQTQSTETLGEGETAPSETVDRTITLRDEDGMLLCYKNLYEMNNDMVGWLKISGTQLDYPVMQTPDDNEFYLDKDFDKEKSDRGAIFAWSEADVNEPSDNITLFGHNMKDGSMFASLNAYVHQETWEENPTITFDTLTDFHTYMIFAVFRTTATKGEGFSYHKFVDAENEKEFNDFVAECKKLAYYDTGITPVYGDKLICLSTCEYTHPQQNGRLVVAAYRIS